MEIYKDLKEQTRSFGDSIREEIKDRVESRFGRFGLFLYNNLPVFTGVAVGGLGRLISTPELILVPPIMDVVAGVDLNKRTLKMYAKYATGFALSYTPEIYQLAQTLADKL